MPTLAVVIALVYVGAVAVLVGWLTMTGRPSLHLGVIVAGALAAVTTCAAVVHVWRAVFRSSPAHPDFAVAWDRSAAIATAGAVVLAVVTFVIARQTSPPRRRSQAILLGRLRSMTDRRARRKSGFRPCTSDSMRDGRASWS